MDQFIDLAILVNNLIRSRRLNRNLAAAIAESSAPPDCEPMQIGGTRLTPEERDRRIRQKLCLYCGQPGHLRISYPTRPSQRNPTAVSTHSFSSYNIEVAVTLICSSGSFSVMAMIDSGSAANLIDADFARSHNLPLIPCNSVLAVAALDGRPLRSGHIRYTTDDITLTSPQNPKHTGPPNCAPRFKRGLQQN